MADISVVAVLGGLFALFVSLVGFTVNYVINSFRSELRQDREARVESMKDFGAKVNKVEKFLEKISDEIFPRLNKLEKDISNLWKEHDIFKAKEANGCGLHIHRREDDRED